MGPRTKTLFHFTESLATLQCILKEGFWPKYVLEDISWLESGIPRLAWPMVSFCDIPISRLRNHTDFYGTYGIGLCRKNWKATGLNPLLYVSPDSVLRDCLRDLLLDVNSNSSSRIRTAAAILLANCKPLEGMAEANGGKQAKDFYSECEWRFIPWVSREDNGGEHGFFLTEDKFQNTQVRDTANAERRQQMLGIVPGDIRYLLVRSWEDASDLISFIDTEMADYAAIVRNMLKTKISVLEEVTCDM